MKLEVGANTIFFSGRMQTGIQTSQDEDLK
jgi:hypothetical protein